MDGQLLAIAAALDHWRLPLDCGRCGLFPSYCLQGQSSGPRQRTARWAGVCLFRRAFLVSTISIHVPDMPSLCCGFAGPGFVRVREWRDYRLTAWLWAAGCELSRGWCPRIALPACGLRQEIFRGCFLPASLALPWLISYLTPAKRPTHAGGSLATHLLTVYSAPCSPSLPYGRYSRRPAP